ncbi:hypothetical protein K1T71_010082 [Dendrolimus kikuchii]|uniref:Uncharacterized protein n=1 Tax=Dendrolimus kikuchii TaxID=765133 RepID=A0ACC1CQT0_9NEOP|nr:hypothetical protein K1T71_010082 [Dendrolimus kikuchii]
MYHEHILGVVVKNKMAVEGVMVSYNYSEDNEHANIVTVSASGIRFANRWVLTHGSILSPIKGAKVIQNCKGKPMLNEEFYMKLPEIYVTCEKRKSKKSSVYEDVEMLSRERSVQSGELEHSSYQIRVLTGRICHVWQCPILDRCVDDILYSWTVGHRDGDMQNQTQLGKALLSVFVLIDLESTVQELKPLRPLSALLDLVRTPPDRGSGLEVHSTPFGCEVFLNAVTRGSICGVVGKRPVLLLTDAATALGSEGGPVFTEGPTKELIGIVVCSVSWWRGEWVGLTLIAPLVSVISAKLRVVPPKLTTPLAYPHNAYGDILDKIDKMTVLVRCGAAWGAGVYLGGGFVMTCAHVVKNQTIWTHLLPAIFAEEAAEKGESVLAAGYPYFNEHNLEDLTPTVTSGHINNVSPSMLQTSCCVQSGFSGGPIYRITSKNSVEVLAIIVSNAKTETGACYPFINMAVPARVFKNLIQQFIADRDVTKLNLLENNKEIIQSQWRLLPYRSKI